MNTFVIKETNTDGYDRFLLWLSFESLIDNLSSIEEAPNMVNSSGRILIDQLFITAMEIRDLCVAILETESWTLKQHILCLQWSLFARRLYSGCITIMDM